MNFLPALDIDVSGHRLPERCARGFVEMRVHQQLSLPSVCELVFAGIEDSVIDASFELGATLALAERGVPTSLFDGRITAIEYAHDADSVATTTVRAYDDLYVLRNRQSVRAHVGLTAAELARELVADLGLDVEAASPGPVWHRLLQSGTDFDLLADATARCGLYLTVQGRVLKLLTLDGSGALQMLRLGENLLEARLEVNSNGACRKVSASAWDPWHGTERSASAASARVGRATAASAPASLVGGKDERMQTATSLQDDAQVQASAQAELDLRTAREVRFWGIAQGNPWLRPGARVQVAGAAARVCGEYVISSARHTLDTQRGWQCEICSTPPEPRARQGGTVMTLGHVSRVDDPEGLGRIQLACRPMPTSRRTGSRCWPRVQATEKGCSPCPTSATSCCCCSMQATSRKAWCWAASTARMACPKARPWWARARASASCRPAASA